MAEYFGACTSSGDPSGSWSNSDSMYTFWRAYMCPGSGVVPLTRLESCVNSNNQSDVDLRLAIYNAAGTTLLAETNTFRLAISNVDSWQGGAVAVNLVGGTDYILAWASGPSNPVHSSHSDETRSHGEYRPVDYSAGFPASLPPRDGWWYMYPVRALVSSVLPQFARPVSDVSAGGWTPSSGSDLFAMVDEVTASDTDYIRSGASPANDAAVVTLGGMSTPAAGTVTLRVRVKYD